MAARFSKGTAGNPPGVKNIQSGKVAEPRTSGHNLRPGSTMPGMPGFINTGQDKSSGGLISSAGVGPKREGPIGSKGGAHRANGGATQARGSMDKSYRATSTGSAGKIEKLSAKTSFEGKRGKSLMY